MSPRAAWAGLPLVVSLGASCSGGGGASPPATPPPDLHFVRGGLVRGGGPERGGTAAFEARAWQPGEVVEGVTAPKLPECVPLFSVTLDDVGARVAMGAPDPGTALAFSPDGRRLAVGTDTGKVLVVEVPTGRELARRAFAEGAAKRVAWAADGGTLYVGEQSPDALLHALDPADLSTRWSRRLADDLETSVLPPHDDVYGLYSLPAAFDVEVLSDGSLLVAGAHGWTAADGKRRNRTRLYRLGADGALLAAWPADGAADATALNPAVSGDTVFFGLSRSADGPAPADLPVGGVLALDRDTLTPRWSRTFPVLEPLFHEVFMWDAVVWNGDWGLVGLGDGRAFVLGPQGQVTATLTPGVPIQSGGVPIATGVGFATGAGERAWYVTSATNIPWGSADPMARPPAPHPAQYTVHAVDRAGRALWDRPLAQATEGVVLSPDGGTLLVTGAGRGADTRTDLFGAVLLDAATGAVTTTCATEGPAYFRPAWAPDGGALAVSESPFKLGEELRGAYRVTVFR